MRGFNVAEVEQEQGRQEVEARGGRCHTRKTTTHGGINVTKLHCFE